jgi:hypothetical protein
VSLLVERPVIVTKWVDIILNGQARNLALQILAAIESTLHPHFFRFYFVLCSLEDE